ncbi:MAG: hypothetical protein KDK45_23900, partial [Leptospiraceae bacterium]|nr:hypothetical protein [Leptospiraceae bacterium]
PHNRKANKEAQMDLLTTYLKTEKNRQQYWDEIWEIIGNDEELLTLYYQLSGKLYSKRIQKSLKNININPAYYAVYESTVVGVASKKIDLEERIKEVVPSDKLKYVYIFRK